MFTKKIKVHGTVIQMINCMVTIMVPDYHAEWGLSIIKCLEVYRDLLFILYQLIQIGRKKLEGCSIKC